MESNTKESNVPLGGIIRLQLKKPKQWNWELTTSKSSPNISMPIFQLFDDHGNLLTEANDPNGCCRRSWDPTTVDKMTQPILITRHKSMRNSFHEPHSVSKAENSKEQEKKYKLRSSKAGTLVVSDDSFEKRPRKHRHHLYTDNNSNINLNKFGNYFEHETLINSAKPNIMHRKTKSDLGLETIRLPKNENIYPMPDYRLFKTRPVQNLCDLSQSKPFSNLEKSNLVHSQSDKVMCSKNRDSNHVRQNKLKLKIHKENTVPDVQSPTYIVQEPITPLSVNNQALPSFSVKKKNRRKYLTKSEDIDSKELSASTDDDNVLESRKQLRRRRKKKGKMTKYYLIFFVFKIFENCYNYRS